MKVKKLPSWLTNPLLYKFFQSRPGRFLSNWVLQGMLYMNPVEIFYKLALDVVLAGGLWWLLEPTLDIQSVICIGLTAHTINWIINCQPVALLMHMDIGKNNPRHFITYIEGLEKRIRKKKFLAASASYGSLSIGNYKPTSDIDIRVIMRPGLWAHLRAAHFCFIERFRAFLFLFPLDLYAFELEEVKRKMSPKEPPIPFYDPEGLLEKTYPELISFEQFRDQFYAEVLPREEGRA